MLTRPIGTPVAIVALAGGIIAPASAGPIKVRTLVLTGQPAPGLPSGAVFGALADPRVDEQGHAMFWARVSGGGVSAANDTAFWSNRSGPLSMVIREGSTAPGTTDLVLSLPTPMFSDLGSFAFTGALGTGAVTQPTNLAVLAEDSLGIGIFARETGALPTLGLPVFNDSGALAFRNGAGTAVWSTRTGAAAIVAATGAVAPEANLPGATFLLLGAPSHNASGDLAFRASISYPGQTGPTQGIWAETSATLHAVAVTGQAVPGLGGSVVFTDLDASPQLTATGATVFWAMFAGGPVSSIDDAAVLVKSGAQTVLVAREGQPAPGLPGLKLGALSRAVAVSDGGVVCYSATLVGPGVTPQSNTALFTVDAATLPPAPARLVAREGDEVLGLPAGVYIATLDRPSISASGRVVFGAYLRGPGVAQDSSYALFAADATGMLHTIARVGDTLTLPPPAAGQRTIAQIVADHGPTQSGLRAYTSTGTLFYKTVFTDNSAALMSAAIPACPADYNADGFADGIDLDLFTSAFEAGDPDADFNNDTFVDGIDSDQYTAAFERGC